MASDPVVALCETVIAHVGPGSPGERIARALLVAWEAVPRCPYQFCCVPRCHHCRILAIVEGRDA